MELEVILGKTIQLGENIETGKQWDKLFLGWFTPLGQGT